jgi:hypothetical protein
MSQSFFDQDDFGEMSKIVLTGRRISSDKLEETSFTLITTQFRRYTSGLFILNNLSRQHRTSQFILVKNKVALSALIRIKFLCCFKILTFINCLEIAF